MKLQFVQKYKKKKKTIPNGTSNQIQMKTMKKQKQKIIQGVDQTGVGDNGGNGNGGSDIGGGGGVSSSNSYTGIPAIEITKESQATGVGYMCGDDDGDGDYLVDTATNANVNNARRRSTVTDISSYDHSPTERQQQQVR